MEFPVIGIRSFYSIETIPNFIIFQQLDIPGNMIFRRLSFLIRIIFILLLIFFSISGNTQIRGSDNTDPAICEDDLCRIEAYYFMGLNEKEASFTDGLESFKRAYELSKKTGHKDYEIKSILRISQIHVELKQLEEVLASLKLIEDYDLLQQDPIYKADYAYSMGGAHELQKNYEDAITWYLEAITISENHNELINMAQYMQAAGNAFYLLRSYDKALEYYQRSADYLTNNDDLSSVARIYYNLALVEDSIPLKRKWYDMAIKISEENGFDNHLTFIYGGLSYMLGMEQGHLDSALIYAKKAVEKARVSDNEFMEIFNITYVGSIYVLKEDYKNALSYLEQIEHSPIIENDRDMRAEVLYQLSKARHGLKIYDTAFNNIDSSLVLHRSVYDEKVLESTSEINAKYETEKKEAEIAKQQLEIERQKNNRNLLLLGSGGIVAILGLGFFGIYQRNKRKREATELALQLEKKRTDDLEQLARIKTDFFNNVSHELRTPLTLIMAPLEDALREGIGGERREELQMALHNSKRLLNLTNEILDLSKIEAAKLELEMSTVDLHSYLIRIFQSFDSLARTRKIGLSHNLRSDQNINVLIDAGKVEKVLNNLIANAIKYSDDGSQVTFDLDYDSLKEDKLVLSIMDEGRGIAEAEQTRIFERFYQSPGSNQSSGTGIGLALVRELLHLMGGDISLKSSPGKGSTFRILVPASKVETEKKSKEGIFAAEEVSYQPIFIGGHRPRILIVEDDLEMSKYLVSLLQSDYEVDVAYNGIQALEKCDKGNYDLISSDIMMPEMDGFEFRERINKMEKGSDTPFIMLTARVLEEDRLRGFRLGVEDYITKPFSSAEFKARIYNLISNKQNRSSIELDAEEVLTHEEEFIRNAESEVLDHLDDSTYNVNTLAQSLNYSTRQLSRLLQKYTGLSPVKFILEIRLQKAFQIIQSRKYATINEVRYDVGIESASYFSSKFKERFGVSPAELVT